jgi:hypothetical protein
MLNISLELLTAKKLTAKRRKDAIFLLTGVTQALEAEEQKVSREKLEK